MGDDRGDFGLEMGDDRGDFGLEMGDDRGESGLEMGDDRGDSGLEMGDDRGDFGLEMGDDRGDFGLEMEDKVNQAEQDEDSYQQRDNHPEEQHGDIFDGLEPLDTCSKPASGPPNICQTPVIGPTQKKINEQLNISFDKAYENWFNKEVEPMSVSDAQVNMNLGQIIFEEVNDWLIFLGVVRRNKGMGNEEMQINNREYPDYNRLLAVASEKWCFFLLKEICERHKKQPKKKVHLPKKFWKNTLMMSAENKMCVDLVEAFKAHFLEKEKEQSGFMQQAMNAHPYYKV
jgi:hypothetical protein